jgi:prevent-host-death family protein
MQTVGAYEAKTHLPRLLAEVARGEIITITKHGIPVARLVPASDGRGRGAQEAIAALRVFRHGKTLGDLRVRDLVEEGRRS